jgi:hypothetical protein
MAVGRIYTLSFQKISVSLAQDLFNVAATASMAFELHSINLGAETVTAAEEVTIDVTRMTATVTNGTGGATVTPAPTVSSQAGATITARRNDATTRATTSGTSTVMWTDTWQLTNGYVYQWAPEDRIQFNLSQNMIIGLDTAPGAAHNVSGSITVAELL